MSRITHPMPKLLAVLLAIGIFAGFSGECWAQGAHATPTQKIAAQIDSFAGLLHHGCVGAGNVQQGQSTQAFIRPVGGLLSNPIPYRRYGQITGVGPIQGSVRIYNMFGVLYMQSAFGGAFGSSSFAGTSGIGGGIGGIGGIGGGGFGGTQNSQGLVGSGLLPGIGSTTTPADDPPQGVLLHVNYANLLFPLQSQLNMNNSINSKGAPGGGSFGGGGFGGFGGIGIGGNGGHGL